MLTEMRNFFLLLILLTFLSCNLDNQIELDGDWLITEMSYNGESLYPKTTNRLIRIIYNGYEGSERITFTTSDSTIILPGFESEQMKMGFSTKKGMLKVYSFKSEPDSILTNKVFIDTFEIEYSNNEKTLRLESDKTYIELISEKKVRSDAIDKAFDGF